MVRDNFRVCMGQFVLVVVEFTCMVFVLGLLLLLYGILAWTIYLYGILAWTTTCMVSLLGLWLYLLLSA